MSTSIETGRTLWVSAANLGGELSEFEWVLSFYATYDRLAVEPQRTLLTRERVTTHRTGFAALAELDVALVARATPRSSDWQIGSTHGYVAWLDLESIERLLTK
ncbi:MAG TPA: hypothetical protein VIJ18_18195 [Microbacteriaceae bacterium]